MKNFKFSEYFRVFLHQTSVSEVPANDFKPTAFFSENLTPGYSLPADKDMFFDYPGRVQAMEQAKKGALSHINSLISKASDGSNELFQYRYNHYNDLNFNLIESNIRKVESDLAESLQSRQLSFVHPRTV